MKVLFKSMWLQLLTAVVLTTAPGVWRYLGIILFAAYFAVWCKVQFDIWHDQELARMKKNNEERGL
jgi:hypothetical protein